MGISVLPREISELIAAGEVIERPASVGKELIENAIDAGAKHITVEIKNGGTTYLRITDDGCGIKSEEVPTAFLRHATSKINLREDLDHILTLGFRGEALASVAAIARIEIMTKRAEDALGTHYVIEGSNEISFENIGCPNGTTIIVRDIFYNVPARKKFLKKDVSEGNAISAILQKIALSHPEISFQFIRENRQDLHTMGDGSLYSAIYAIYGRGFAQDLIPVSYTDGNISIEGYTIKPLYAKQNRAFQNFFINGRYVRTKTGSAALEEAYQNLIMTGKFPACILNMDMEPSMLDVNVHPTKAEVRFTDEKSVFSAIFFAVKNALMQAGLIYEFQMKPKHDWANDMVFQNNQSFHQTPIAAVPDNQPQYSSIFVEPSDKGELHLPPQKSASLEEEFTVTTEDEKLIEYQQKEEQQRENRLLQNIPKEECIATSETIEKEITPISVSTESVSTIPTEETLSGYSFLNPSDFIKKTPLKQESNASIQTESEPKNEAEYPRVIGELFQNYILAEWKDSMYMVDKHAAHERVIFEQLRARNRGKEAQFLAVPAKILLSSQEIEALTEHDAEMQELGFHFEYDIPYVSLTAMPVTCMQLNPDEIVPELCENLIACKQNPQTTQLDDYLHTLACKAAIRARDKSSIRELQALLNEIWNNPAIRHCPHGRPILFELTKREIEKQFKRIV